MLWVKICGVKERKIAELIEELGFNAIGLNFYPPSPRYVTPEQAQEITRDLKIKKVGIFVNEDPSKILETGEKAGLDFFQLHGNETPEVIEKIGPERVIKAIPADENLQKNLELFNNLPLFAILLDTPGKIFGGSGKRFNWENFKEIASKISHRIIVAGGLTPWNFCHAIKLLKPFGLDFNSGVEKEKGEKDPEKIKLLSKKLKEERCSD